MKFTSALRALWGVAVTLLLGVILTACQSSPKPQPEPAPAPQPENTVPAQTKPSPTAAFTLESKKDLTLSKADLKKAQSKATKGKVSGDGGTLTFDQKDISLVATSGPEDDMFSFRIQGVRNPTLKIPAAASLTVLFVNVDDDMSHDFTISTLEWPIAELPTTAKSMGGSALPHERNESYSAQELTFSAPQKGVTNYFCSVPGHAKNGMWGAIIIGKVDSSQKVLSGHDVGKSDKTDADKDKDDVPKDES